ncbi:hypothetical protein GAYE_SCF18G3829 [Galdieria yellowstonensis]|uniref:tRNA threonylcarbamoyladenosine biosynthesis protein TsaE n=1 Tax=Galdieria yellowstonensis TaxID=3028027 RepID=A0AAV9IEX0_9RHOD|nr:hypothetical protein GAYE_SCF18G3829 [Galdieria yellowstonensis]
MNGSKSSGLCFLGQTSTVISVSRWMKPLQRREIDLLARRKMKLFVFRGLRKESSTTHIKNTGCCQHLSNNVVSKAIVLREEQETEKLASIVADNVTYGDVILLYGDFGTGKTTFARAFIRKILCDPLLSVPSPSYLLMNEYETTREIQGQVKKFFIYHLDLWRIESCESLPFLDLQGILQRGVCLIEWPAAIENSLPYNKLVLRFSFLDEGRKVELSMFGPNWHELQECISRF